MKLYKCVCLKCLEERNVESIIELSKEQTEILKDFALDWVAYDYKYVDVSGDDADRILEAAKVLRKVMSLNYKDSA